MGTDVWADGAEEAALRLVEETGLPKPTLHRMLQQLEGAGLLQREGDGRQYSLGVRLRRLAENLLLNDSHHGARHAVLRRLVDEVGESLDALRARQPMGRLGSTEEIAQAVLYLASDAAAFITGTGLVIDGGLTAA
jgi:DNA-binding IclR family transcriptional regulator